MLITGSQRRDPDLRALFGPLRRDTRLWLVKRAKSRSAPLLESICFERSSNGGWKLTHRGATYCQMISAVGSDLCMWVPFDLSRTTVRFARQRRIQVCFVKIDRICEGLREIGIAQGLPAIWRGFLWSTRKCKPTVIFICWYDISIHDI